MAQGSRGEARSVPDPVGDRVEAIHRAERLKRERAEDAALLARSAIPSPFSHSERLRGVREAPPTLRSTVSIGGRTFREIDNGRAKVLVPTTDTDPFYTAAEREEQRRAINRALFMTRSPLGSLGYLATTAAGAPQRVRDGFLVGGGFIDAAMGGGAPRGAPLRGAVRRPQASPEAPGLRREPILYRELDANGNARGTISMVTTDMVGRGRRPDRRIKPPGWQGHGGIFNEARGHLHAGQLGGSYKDPRNFVTLTQNPTNSPHMKTFEDMVANRARAGEVVDYTVTPMYGAGAKPPGAVLMTAHGPRGSSAKVVFNPAGRRR